MSDTEQGELAEALTAPVMDEAGLIQALSRIVAEAAEAKLPFGTVIGHMCTTLAHMIALAVRAEGMFPEEIESALDNTLVHVRTIAGEILTRYDEGNWPITDDTP